MKDMRGVRERTRESEGRDSVCVRVRIVVCVCVFLCVQIIIRAVGALIEIGICRLSDDYHYPQIPSVMSLGK